MINKYTNKQRGLLAVIMAMVMVFAGAAFVAAEVDAADGVTVYVDTTYTGTTYNGKESTPYKTIEDAIGANSTTDGSTIVLKSNVNLTSQLVISKSLIIDLNEKKLSVIIDKKVVTYYAAIDGVGEDVTIKNGELYIEMNGYSSNVVGGTGINAIRATTLIFDDVDGEMYIGATSAGVVEGATEAVKKDSHVTWANTLEVKNGSVIDAYGANRGLYANEISIKDSTVTSGGFEKGIRAENTGAATISITGSSVVNAVLIPGGEVNTGENDCMGVKAKKISIGKGSELIADGVHVTETGSTIGGKLTVTYNEQSGKYAITKGGISEVLIPAGLIVGTYDSSSAPGGTISMNDADAEIVVAGKNVTYAVIDITVTDKTANATFDGLKAADGGYTISVGSIDLGGAIVVEAGKLTVTNGAIVLEDVVFELVDDTDASNTTPVAINFSDREVKIIGNVTVPLGVELVADKITVEKDSMLNVAGKVNATVTNNGIVALTDDTAIIPDTMQGTGSVDIGAIQEDADLGGTINSDTIFTQGQTVTLTSDTNLVNATKLTIKGTLIIPEDVTLTLKDTSMLIMMGSTAKLYNYGNIVIESKGQEDTNVRNNPDESKTALSIVGGYGENNGTISLVYDDEKFNGEYWINYSMYIRQATFDNNGTIDIAEFNTLGIDRTSPDEKTVLNNNANSSIDVQGMVIGYINNASDITIDGFAWGWIHLTSTDAIVDIVSLQTYGVGTELVIDNNGLKYGKDLKVTESNIDSITLVTNANSLTTTYALEGIVIKTAIHTSTDSSGDPEYEPYMDVSGNAAVETSEEIGSDNYLSKVKITFANDVWITTELTVNKNITLNNGAELKITGDMVVAKGVFTSVGTVEVTGELIVISENITGGTITATYYKVKGDTASKTPDQHIYTNFSDAITAAPKDITVYGELRIKTEITIPADVKVKMDNGKMTITKDGNLTVADGSKLTLYSTGADVKGVLLVENKKNLTGTVKSDVVTTNDKTVLYSGLAYALSVATDGQTVKVSDDVIANPVVTETDITIPAGVTLDTNRKGLQVGKDCTLTIDGKLYLNGGVLSVAPADSLKAAGKVILNGSIKSTQEMNYNVMDGKLLSGAYFTMLEDGVLYNYVEPVTVAASKVASIYNQEISIIGVEDLGDVAFAGTNDDPVTITIAGLLKSGKLAIDYGTVILADGVNSITLASADGSVTLVKAVTVGFKAVSEDISEEKVFYVTGKTTGTNADLAKKVETNIITDGIVSLKKVDLAYATIGGDVVVIGGTENTSTIGYLQVTGTLTIDNVTTLNVAKNAYVTGTLATAEKTDSKVAGKVVVKDALYVGFDWTTPVVTTSGVATVTEGVVTEKVMYVLAGASVPESTVEDMIKVEFYVDDALYMIAYAVDANQKLIGLPAIDSGEYQFDGWMDGKVKIDDNTVIGSITDDIVAEITYDVYTVKFVKAEGIDDIYLDGVLVGDLAVGVDVAAGQHTISYTLANGYTGEAKMLVNGSEVSGCTFTASGDYQKGKDSNGINYTITLQGIEKAPAEVGGGDAPSADKDEGMDLTDILLIVLVVLIVIMAIIVALRMMRS